VKRVLGNLERQLFAYTQMRKLRVVRTRDLTAPLGITDKQERELLSRLARAGMIAQVCRGLYLVPPRLPLGGKWSPDESLVLATLIADPQSRKPCCVAAPPRSGFSPQRARRTQRSHPHLGGECVQGW